MTIEVQLTEGKVALVDDVDAPLVVPFRWQAWQHRHTWYARRTASVGGNSVLLLMHRVLLPGAREVDHRDGNGLNNTRSNLRASTTSQNHSNMRAQTGRSSRFKGVSWFKRDNRWRVQIQAPIDGISKNRHVGYFATEEAAAHAYDDAARKLFGEFAALNFPRPGENSCHGRTDVGPDRDAAATVVVT